MTQIYLGLRYLYTVQSYYEQLLNKPPTTPTDDLISAATCAQEDPDINCEETTSAEVAIAISRLKNEKASGICGITAEMLKAGRTCSVEWLTQVCQNAWRSDDIPPDWKQ